MNKADHISDFPDKLNPMLVKELRQGLRGLGFVALFIAIQAFLCLILLITSATESQENVGNLISRIILFFFSIAVLVIQPLRGITALSSEIRGNTIDLLCLTKLSAWRITFGKWVSIVSQSGLILTAIIPYLILRYFFGDMQMFAEIILLLSTFLLSATFTAVTVGLSGTSSTIIRVFLPIIGSIVVFFVIWPTYFGGRFAYQSVIRLVSLNDTESIFIYLGFVATSIYLIWISLDMGASAIAPLANNRSSLRRVISIGFLIIAILIFCFTAIPVGIALSIGLILSLPVSIVSLTEKTQLVPPVVTPFIRRGTMGKIAGKVLYPGWATGLVFTLILYGLLYSLLSFYSPYGSHVSESKFIVLNCVFAMLFFSVALTNIFARNHKNRFAVFILIIIGQYVIILTVFVSQSSSTSNQILPLFCWIPASLTFLGGHRGLSPPMILTISYCSIALYALIALATSGSVWKHIREIEHKATYDQ